MPHTLVRGLAGLGVRLAWKAGPKLVVLSAGIQVVQAAGLGVGLLLSRHTLARLLTPAEGAVSSAGPVRWVMSWWLLPLIVIAAVPAVRVALAQQRAVYGM
ncbi:hypothetical protein, partial [Streptomyces virginiae]|uniref:hypothetical protein n=1 Tax=Streptomyces virginiae TaxID=1961 RepID=UPI00332957FA